MLSITSNTPASRVHAISVVSIHPGQSPITVLDEFRRRTGHTGHCILKFSRPPDLNA